MSINIKRDLNCFLFPLIFFLKFCEFGSFIPSLKDKLADKINQLLNDSEFTESPLKFTEIIPNYSEDMAIYCICGEITEISVINICNWKNKFKYYLFEGRQCQQCGDKIYAISLMDEDTEIPEELKEIFS